MAKSRIKATLTDTIEASQDFQAYSRFVSRELQDQVSELRFIAVSTLQEAAPEKSGKLKAGVRARRRGTEGFDITLHARNEETGFDYALVSRFGHQVEYIYPKHAKALKLPLSYKSSPIIKRGSKGKGQFTLNVLKPQLNLRARVRGYKPDRDWAFDAIDDLDPVVNYVAKKLAARLDVRVFTG
jgi:hypothetical protein